MRSRNSTKRGENRSCLLIRLAGIQSALTGRNLQTESHFLQEWATHVFGQSLDKAIFK
jgi:hypothetical protein